MAQERLTLDNPIFAHTLRQPRRSVPAYQSRPTQPQTVQDVQFVRSLQQLPTAPRQSPSVATRPVMQRAIPLERTIIHEVRSQAATATAPVQTAAQTTGKKPSKHIRWKVRPVTGLMYVLAGLLFVAGGYVAFSSLTTNEHVKAQVKQIQQAADSSSDNSSNDTPTTEKPSAKAVSSYAVAANLARYLDIPKLNVHARVIPLGVKSDNTLKAPGNGYDVGWYNASSRPGENGAMLVDGHSNVLGTPGVFAKLPKLVAGDVIKVTRGDGKVLSYKVRTVETVDDKKVDMSSLLVSADTAKPGLNLITCAGDVIPGTLHLDKRALIRAVLE